MLLGSLGLAQDRGVIRGKVTGAEGQAIDGATVMFLQVHKILVTGADGGFSLRVPPGTYQLLVSAPGFETAEKQVQAEAGKTVTRDFQLEEGLAAFGQELVVLGSRTQRTAIDSAVPVDVLARADIEATGMTETSRILQFLAPSFNFSTSTISDGTDIVRPSTLRGLGPDQTLVLLNGKRRHNSALVHVNGSIGRGAAGVDLNAIPASAIDRIEVLRDGASAQYGSDAIAGVINMRLKRDTGETEVNLNTGTHYAGDGEVVQASVNHGWRIAARGFVNLTAEYRDRGATNRAGLDFRQQYALLPDGSADPRELTFDRLNHRYGDADSQNAYLFLNGLVPVGEDGEIYFFGGLADRDGESGGFYRRALDARNLPEVYPDGFLPLIKTDVEDQSLAVGYKTLLGPWLMDASLTHGANAFNFFISNSVNVSLGPTSPASADAGTLNFGQTTLNLDFTGSMDWGGHAPVNLAFGVEYRTDAYEIEAGEEASWVDGGLPDQYGGRAAPGIQVFPGFRPDNALDEDRDNLGVYAELEGHLTERFLIDAALRFEDYSDFGNNVSYKLAGRFQASETLAFRGSASTGFRAPSLHQAFFNNTSTQFVVSDETGELIPFEVGTFRNDDPVTQAFGVPALAEETSFNLAAGFTYRPRKNLQITLDVFQIDIDDRIVISGRFQAEADPNGPIRAILSPFNVNAAQFFSNAIDTETEGVDLVVSHASDLGGGTLKLTAAFNWNDTDVVGTVRTPTPLAGLEQTLFDRIERERIEEAQPRQHYNLAANFSRGGFDMTLRANYFGSVKTVESNGNTALDQRHRGRWVADLDLGYDFRNGVEIAVGANNLFDTYPDRNIAANSFGGIFAYPRRTAPFGINGGYVYVRAGYRF